MHLSYIKSYCPVIWFCLITTPWNKRYFIQDKCSKYLQLSNTRSHIPFILFEAIYYRRWPIVLQTSRCFHNVLNLPLNFDFSPTEILGERRASCIFIFRKRKKNISRLHLGRLPRIASFLAIIVTDFTDLIIGEIPGIKFMYLWMVWVPGCAATLYWSNITNKSRREYN